MAFALQRTIFGYNRVGDVDKLLFESFGLGKLRFNATSHLKPKANELFS